MLRFRCFWARWKPRTRAVRLAVTGAMFAIAIMAWASPAGATFSGRDGALLVSTGGFGTWSPFPTLSSAPQARAAECGYPSTLWTAWPDGSHQIGLRHGDTGLFSPRGQRLAIDYGGDPCYAGTGTDPSAGLFVSDANGAGRHRIGGQGLVGWLPGGRLLVWKRSADQVQLLDPMAGLVIMTVPALSLEPGLFSLSCSARLAVVRHTPHGYHIDVFTRKAARVQGRPGVRIVAQQVAASRYPLQNPTWSPDGRSLLFSHQDTRGDIGPTGLWSVGAGGRALHRLSDPHGAAESDPAWSPDGRQILFIRTRANAHSATVLQMVVMRSNGSDQNVLVHFPADDSIENALWAPDGQSIAFYPWDGLWIVDANTGVRSATIPFEGAGLVDWQALPGGRTVRCADPMSVPITVQPPLIGRG